MFTSYEDTPLFPPPLHGSGNAAGRVLALPLAHLGSTPDSTYGPLNTARCGAQTRKKKERKGKNERRKKTAVGSPCSSFPGHLLATWGIFCPPLFCSARGLGRFPQSTLKSPSLSGSGPTAETFHLSLAVWGSQH